MGLACLEVGDPAVQETQRGTNATYVDEVGEEGAVGAGQQRRHPHGSFFLWRDFDGVVLLRRR